MFAGLNGSRGWPKYCRLEGGALGGRDSGEGRRGVLIENEGGGREDGKKMRQTKSEARMKTGKQTDWKAERQTV